MTTKEQTMQNNDHLTDDAFEDDFIFGDQNEEEKKPEEKEDSAGGSDDDENSQGGESEGDSDADDKKDSEDDKTGEEKDDDKKKEDEEDKEDEENVKKSDEEGKKEEGDKEEGDKDEEEDDDEDFFDTLVDDSKSGDEDKSDYSRIAKDLDLEYEEGEDPSDQELFQQKIQKRIDDAKQEFDLSQYDETTQSFIKFMNDGNADNITDVFADDKISQLQSAIAMNPEEKVGIVLRNELQRSGLSGDELKEKVNERIEELSTREIKDYADKIDDNAKKGIEGRLKEIVGEHQKSKQQQEDQKQEQQKEQRKNFSNFVDRQDEFMGLKLTSKFKEAMKTANEQGKIDKVVNSTDPEVQYYAYMMKNFGRQIQRQIDKRVSEDARKSYNDSQKKHLDRLHRTKDGASSKSSGHHKDNSDQEGKGWAIEDIE